VIDGHPYLQINLENTMSAAVLASLFGKSQISAYFVNASIILERIFSHVGCFIAKINSCECIDLANYTVALVAEE
jgi:hypothetical protein